VPNTKYYELDEHDPAYNIKFRQNKFFDEKKATQNRYIARLKAELAADPDHPKHGHSAGYTMAGCRCPKCQAAAEEYRERQKLKRRAIRERGRRLTNASNDDTSA